MSMFRKPSPIAKKIFKFVIIAIGLGIIGFAFALIGVLIGGRVLGGDSDGFGALGLAFGGLVIGYPAGIIVGIFLIKRIFHQRGSLLLSILGSIFGAVFIVALAEPFHFNENANLLFGLFFLSVPVFCLAGFLLRR